MACVDWISSFRLLNQKGFTYLGDIPILDWNNRRDTSTYSNNSFIAISQLRPSRFALAYIPPTNLSEYVNVAFIALDSENLHEDTQQHYDFGDSKFPYYKGNKSKRLEEFMEEDDSDDEDTEYVTNVDVDKLYQYIPNNVYKFLMTPLNRL